MTYIPRYWPFVRIIYRSPVNSPHKGQWRGALMFSLICAWISGWVSNHEAGDSRRHRAHNDVIVMTTNASSIQANTYDMVRHILAHGRTCFVPVNTLVGPATRTILVSSGAVCDHKVVSLIFDTWNILTVFSPYIHFKFNPSPRGQKSRHFADDICRCIFVNEKFCILIKTSLKFVRKGQQLQASIGLGNCLVPNRRQSIIWTNADPTHWHGKFSHFDMLENSLMISTRAVESRLSV